MDANRVSHPVKKPIKFFGKKTSENVLFASDSAFLVFVLNMLLKDL